MIMLLMKCLNVIFNDFFFNILAQLNRAIGDIGGFTGKVRENVNYMYMIGLLPFSITNLNIIPETSSGFERMLYGIIVLSMLTLWCFIDIVGHFITIYLVDHKYFRYRFPRLVPVLNYFKKTNYIFLGFEIVFVVCIYLMLIGICVMLLYEV